MKTLVKMLDAEVVKRTEKAALINVTYSLCDGEMRGRRVWFPLSQIEVREDGVYANSWIIGRKEEEIGGRIEVVLRPAPVAENAKTLTVV